MPSWSDDRHFIARATEGGGGVTLGRFIVIRANEVCAETNGASSRYHESYDSAADEARSQSRKSQNQQYAVAQIVGVFVQEMQTIEKRINEE